MKRNPGTAAVLSFFFAGLGQIYNGQIGKGLLFFAAQVTNLFLMFIFVGFVTAPIIWIWGMIDAYRTAERMNEKESRALWGYSLGSQRSKCRQCGANLIYPWELGSGYCSQCQRPANDTRNEYPNAPGQTRAEDHFVLEIEDPYDVSGEEELELSGERSIPAEDKELLVLEEGALREGQTEQEAAAENFERAAKIAKLQNTAKKNSPQNVYPQEKRTIPVPKFSNREEYERWKEERMQGILGSERDRS